MNMNRSFTVFQKHKISVAGHSGGTNVGSNNIHVDFFVGRDDDGSGNASFDISPVIPCLPVKDKTVFKEDALKYFPVDWG
jgi:hypothetical protein